MREYLLVLLVAAATTFLLGGVVRRFAVRIGAVTPIRERDVHTAPMPRLGGLAVLGGIAAAVLVAGRLPFLGLVPEVGHDARALLAGCLVMALVGGIDDVIGLDPVTKLAAQVLAAGIVVVLGVQLYWIPLPNGSTISLSPVQGAVISTLVIVAIANAVNLVDGLDGLATGIVCLGAAAFFTYSYLLAYETGLNRAMTATLVTATITGACLGFLPHNFRPARVFLGDSGAYLLGLLLAGSTISLTGFLDPRALTDSSQQLSLLPALLPIVLPIAVVAVPFVEVLTTVIRRMSKGRFPFDPDAGHLHHRLMKLGHSHVGAVLIMYVWSAIFAFGAVAVGLRPDPLTFVLLGAAGVFAVVITLLVPHRRRPAVAATPAAVRPPAVADVDTAAADRWADPVAAPAPADAAATGPSEKARRHR